MNKIPLEDACYGEIMVRIAYAVLARHWRIHWRGQSPLNGREYVLRIAQLYVEQGLCGIAAHIRMIAPGEYCSVAWNRDKCIERCRQEQHYLRTRK